MPLQSDPAAQQRRFSIALSYPGERRPFVEKVAAELRSRLGSRVFYDRDYEAELARPDLDIYLQNIYHDDSELIAVFLCADYERKDWCGLEWRVVRDLIKRRQASAIMPLRFDDTEIPGLFSTDGYVWLADRSPQQVAALILQRIEIKLKQDVAAAQSKLEKLKVGAGNETGAREASLSGSMVEELFAPTLCSKLSSPVRMQAARSLAASLRERTQLDGDALFRAGRFVVEHRLLTAEGAPHCELTTERKAVFAEEEEELWSAVEEQLGATSAFGAAPRIAAAPGPFLERAQERAEDWYGYFNALKNALKPAPKPEEIQTLCSIEVEGKGAAIAPQYLVAGLMSHFHDDWAPVIRGYTDVGAKAGMLERLKASQWICWLVWGPSIPLCKCPHWRPLSAYQFGYGDENNSLPVYFTGDPEPVLKLLRSGNPGDRRAIHVKSIVGHLAWAPFTFDSASGFAPAQARLTTPAISSSKGANEHAANGLLIKLEKAEPRKAHPKDPAYFTSYIWLMFWVTGTGKGASLQRLDGERLPAPADPRSNAELMSAGTLWSDLLPVFVHANIFDAVVLRFQKGMLIENALHLLRCAWESDNKNIEFHLVCASDYSGCGCQIEFPAPPGESLLELLRLRLAAMRDDDAAFAQAVYLPDEKDTDATRAAEFRYFFAACHLPEMVDGYYKFLKDKVSD